MRQFVNQSCPQSILVRTGCVRMLQVTIAANRYIASFSCMQVVFVKAYWRWTLNVEILKPRLQKRVFVFLSFRNKIDSAKQTSPLLLDYSTIFGGNRVLYRMLFVRLFPLQIWCHLWYSWLCEISCQSGVSFRYKQHRQLERGKPRCQWVCE
jgi:hypothetical protein